MTLMKQSFFDERKSNNISSKNLLLVNIPLLDFFPLGNVLSYAVKGCPSTHTKWWEIIFCKKISFLRK